MSDLVSHLPGFGAGLFLARVLGEWAGLPGAWAAILLSLAIGLVGSRLFARRPLGTTWPLLILFAYVIYPEPDWSLAAFVFVVCLVALGLNRLSVRQSARYATGDKVLILFGAVIAAGFFLLYLATLAPDVLPADSGELQVVAAQLGVAHPPGFPLYVMMAHAFTRVLASLSPAYAVNVFSAVTSALTLAIVFLTCRALSTRYLTGVLAVVVLGTSATFWSQATTANVRSLTGLFTALIVLTLVRFRRSAQANDGQRADRWLGLMALFMGLGLTHHVSLLFLAAVGLAYVLLADRTLLRSPRRWLRPLLLGLAGLLPLLYLPLRAGADVRGASPGLATISGFLEHVLATGFRGDLFYFISAADLWQRLLVMVNVTTFQFVPVVLVGGIAGLIWLLLHDRLSAFLLGGTFALYLIVAATYRAPQTVEYMIPAYIVGAILTGNATRFLPDRTPNVQLAGGVAIAIVSMVIVGALSQFERNITASGARHEATDARDTAGRLLSEAPPNSTILAHWHWATPLWYLQEVEGARPDLDVRFVFPDGESYALTWERRAKEAFAAGRPVITTWVPASPIDDLPVPEPIGEGQLYPQTTRSSLPEDFIQVNQLSGEQVEILGYKLDHPTMLTPGEEFVITVAWRPGAGFQDPSGLFVHLTGPDAVIYGQDDRPAHSSGAVTLTEFRVTPRPETPVGELTVQFGVAAEADQRVPLTKVSVKPSRTSLVTRNPVNRLLLDSSDQRLIGYDWDHTLADRSRLYLHWQSDDGTYSTQVIDDEAIESPELPAYRGPWGVPVTRWEFPRGRDGGHYVPFGQGIVWTGETLNGLTLSPGQSFVVDQELRSSRPINRDHVVSVRLIGLEPESDQWAWWDLQDSIPAMGAIPTLKWIRGTFVRSPHRLTVDEAATPEQELTGALTLYDAFTNRPLPILDDRITDVNPWIPLCTARVGE